MLTRRQAVLIGPSVALFRGSASAQQPSGKEPVVGLISTAVEQYPGHAAFVQALNQAGFVRNQQFRLEPRFAGGNLERLAEFAAEMVRLNVDVIAVIGAVTVRAVRAVTTTIPTVFTVVLDPIEDGLIADAQRPGGNITGATNFDPAQAPAQMRLIKELVSDLKCVAILGDEGVPDLLDKANIAAANAEGLRYVSFRMKGADENLEEIFSVMRDQNVGAILGLEVPRVGLHSAKVMQFASSARLPTIYPADGARFKPMIAYGTSLIDAVGLMGGLVGRILKGEKPGDIPIAVSKRHHMTIDQGVARRIGFAIPPQIIARADKVID